MVNTKSSNRRKAINEIIEVSPSAQYKALISIVKDSGAFNNKFFEKCHLYGLSKEELRNYVINWYSITESFAKYGLLYTHFVAKYISENFTYESPVYKKYEKYFCEVLEISSGEFRISKIAPREFHPRTFTRLAPKLGVRIKDLVNRSFEQELNPETVSLEKCIIDNFKKEKDILSGFANYFVVETIAYNIVESMDNSFGKFRAKNGEKLYTEDEKIYISEHLRLEVEHCGEVKHMLKTLDLSNDDFEHLSNEVEKLSTKFGKFWNSLLAYEKYN